MDLRKHLIDSDPVSSEPELSAFDAQMMRQRVILEARNAERERFWEPEAFSRAWWLRPIAVATVLAACLVAAVGLGLRINERQPVAPAPVNQQTTRQLQFSTPGGTRIIWTFHQDLDL